MTQKLTLALLLALAFATLGWAQSAPQGFNYQSVVRDPNGTAYANQTINMIFTIRSGAANGPVAYVEKHTTNTNEFGLVNLVVGQGTILSGEFTSINWGGGSKYLTVSVETAPNVFDEIGATELLSVPYALFAQTAANGGGGGGGNDNWGTQTAQTDPTLKGSGTGGNPLGIAPQNAQTGQVLKWNGTTWAPANDLNDNGFNGTVTQVNTSNGIVGGPITNTGTIGLSNTGVTPGAYGSATQIPVVSVDAQGRVTSIFTTVVSPGTIGLNGGAGIAVQQNGSNFTISNTGDLSGADDLTNSTQANGDVTGTFSNLQIKTDAVGSAEIADGSVNTAELADNGVTASKLAANSVGTNNLINGSVTAAKLNNMSAANGQVLKWNGTTWAPAADNTGTLSVSGGTGIAVSGTPPNITINNTGDTNASDDLTTASQANGDVTGVFSNLQIKADAVGSAEIANNAVGSTEIADNAVGSSEITDGSVNTAELANSAVTAPKIDDMGATSGQVLKWNGTTWAPGSDNTGGSITITQGPGISVIVGGGGNYTVSNTGDTDPSDDLSSFSQANGDVTGTFDNLQIKGNAVTSTELATNAVITTKLADGAVTAAKLAQMGATSGQALVWNGSAWAPATVSGGGGGTVSTNTTLIGNGSVGSPLGLAQQGATSGQSLVWNGSAWAPATIAGGGTVTTNATLTGNGTVGTPLGLASQGANSGQILRFNGTSWAPSSDSWGTQSVVTGSALFGNGTAANPLNLAQQGATNGQVLAWNGTTNNWAPVTLSGSGTGDDWGAQTVESNVTLDGDGTPASPLKIAQQGASSGQVLKWNGSNWAPATDNGADNWGSQVVQTNATLSGGGTAANPLALATQGASNGQVLKFNGTTWVPAADNAGGSDNWGTQTAVTGSALTGNGTPANPLNLAQQSAAIGQVLKWNGSQWAPDNDDTSGGGTSATYQAGTGISITGGPLLFNINNAGDLSNFNEIQSLSISGQTLSISNGNSVTLPSSGGSSYTAGTGITITGTAPNQTINNAGDLSNFNEIQSLSISGQTLSISNGNSVTLPGGTSYTAGTGISITGNAINNTGDLSATNEIQTISLTGNLLSLTQGGGSVTIDPSSVNELQNLSLNGTTLKISGTNSTVKLDTILSNSGLNLWQATGNNIRNLNTGNVGIGITTPIAKLHVRADNEVVRLTGANPRLTFDNTGGSNGFLRATNGQFAMGSADSSDIALISGTGQGGLTVNGVSGNVGIGTAPGAPQLLVRHKQIGLALQNSNNNHQWEFWVTNPGGELALYNDQFDIAGAPAGVFAIDGVYTSSDRSLKKDINPLPAVLDRLLKLEPVNYRFKTQQESNHLSLGFIAQDVQNQFPELVSTAPVRNGKGGTLMVNYAGFGVLAVKAVQEQQAQIQQLQAENTALKARLDAIEARLKN